MSDLFRIALGQMTVAETGTENLAKAVSLMKRAFRWIPFSGRFPV